MAYETLLLEKQGYVAVLTLNRPPTKTVSYAMLGEQGKAQAEEATDKDTRVLVITGAGDRCFSAGMDVSDAMSHPDVGEVAVPCGPRWICSRSRPSRPSTAMSWAVA